MDAQTKKFALLGQAPVPSALLAMGIPTMLGMMINALYNLVDAYFVAGLGTSQMGAISVFFPISQMTVGLGLLFGNGAGSYISRLLGKGAYQTADRAASTAVYGCLLTGAVMIAVLLLTLKPLLVLFGATAGILPYALTYAKLYLAFSLFNLFNVTMNNLVTSEGAAKTTMAALLLGAVLNMVLDPLFIYGLHLGVAGAALATAVGQMASAAVYLGYVARGNSAFHFRMGACNFTRPMLTEIFKIGVPTLVFQLLTGLAILCINVQSSAYGDSMIAAMGAVTRIISMGSLMVFGFLKGFQPIAGYSYGAGDYGRLQEAIKVSLLWSTAFCVLYGLGAALLAEPIMAQFTAYDLELLAVGQKALQANGLSFVLFGFYTVYSSLLLAMGKGGAGFFLGACRQGICFVPVILLLPLLWGQQGIIYAQPLADVLSALVAAVMAVPLHRQLAKGGE